MAGKKRRKAKARVLAHPIRELREAVGLTREELAERIGRTRPFITMLEEYEGQELGRETALRLFDEFRTDLNRLGITAEDLLRGYRGAPSRGPSRPAESAA
jgi:transcriptional regulator with XRE-family HTH domain